MQRAYRLTSDDVVLQKTTYSFDVSVWELLWPVLNGGKLVMARPGEQADKGYLAETIKKHGASLVHYVPTMLQVFLDRIHFNDVPPCVENLQRRSPAVRSPATFLHPYGCGAAQPLRANRSRGIDVTYWPCRAQTIPGCSDWVSDREHADLHCGWRRSRCR